MQIANKQFFRSSSALGSWTPDVAPMRMNMGLANTSFVNSPHNLQSNSGSHKTKKGQGVVNPWHMELPTKGLLELLWKLRGLFP